ncbi:MAG: hypothetical protein HUU10_04465 [Bacteroidetes bacterium]|nr:hypothetical protein [Bacteroidota bacterium]
MRIFTQSDYDSLLKVSGSDADYYAGHLCSCLADNNGQPDPDCDCVFGFRYDSPVTTKVQYNQVSEYLQVQSNGRIPAGSCNITFYPTYRDSVTRQIVASGPYNTVQNGDILVFRRQVLPDRQIMIKGSQEVIYAFGLSHINRVSYRSTEYVAGEDYDTEPFTTGGFTFTRIIWLEDGNRPEEGARYVVEFQAWEQYYCMKPIKQDRGSDEMNLPKKMRFVKRSYEFQKPEESGFDNLSI